MADQSNRILEQRIRNRVTEYLELAGSFEQQIEYAWTVPAAYVPHEVLNQWEDWVPTDPADGSVTPVYSTLEVAALTSFHRAWLAASEALADDAPSLAEVHALPAWLALRDEARAARAVFGSRGPMPEDHEVE